MRRRNRWCWPARHPRKLKEGMLISRQDFSAMRAFLASEDGSDLPEGDGDDGVVDDPWEDPAPAPLAPPVVCMRGGTFRLAALAGGRRRRCRRQSGRVARRWDAV
jgi:hypothetical protein